MTDRRTRRVDPLDVELVTTLAECVTLAAVLLSVASTSSRREAARLRKLVHDGLADVGLLKRKGTR